MFNITKLFEFSKTRKNFLSASLHPERKAWNLTLLHLEDRRRHLRTFPLENQGRRSEVKQGDGEYMFNTAKLSE